MKRMRVFVVVPVIASALVLTGFLVSYFIFSGNFGPNASYLQTKYINKAMAKERAETKPSKAAVAQRVQRLQMPFIANEGQADERVRFYANTFGGTVFVTKEGEIVYSLLAGRGEEAGGRKQGCIGAEGQGIGIMNYGPQIPLSHATENQVGWIKALSFAPNPSTAVSPYLVDLLKLNPPYKTETQNPQSETCPQLQLGIQNLSSTKIGDLKSEAKGIALIEQLVGGKIGEIRGEAQSVTKVSYFKGNDPSKWKSNISTYQLVNLGEIYEGVELKLKAHGNNVEKLLYVKPGADWVRLRSG